MLVDLNADAVAAKARQLGDNARSAVADISQEAAAEAAVQATVWRHDPQWRLAWGWRDVVAVVGLDVVLVTAIAIYLRLKGH